MNQFPIIHRNTTIGTAQVNAVSARELHEKLGVKRAFTTWIKYRIEQAMLTEEVDYVCVPVVESKGRGGHNRVDYIISLDAAKHVAMLERTEIGKAIRQYFIDVEKAAAEAAKTHPALQAQMDEAASLMAGVLAENKALKPAASLGNVVTNGRTSWPINIAAKELGVKRDTLRTVMVRQGYMDWDRDWTHSRCLPSRLGVSMGLFDNEGYPFGFTFKGLQTAYGLLVAWGEEPREVVR